MGLDMFLYGVHKKQKEDIGEPSSGNWEQCCYWRKANQIHSWFDQHFIKGQNPWGLYEVEEKDIQGLLLICKLLKKIKDNPDEEISWIDTKWFEYLNRDSKEKNGWDTDCADMIAYAILPPDNLGCCFGSGTVDEWYWDQIDNTIKQLTKALKQNYDCYFYTASW